MEIRELLANGQFGSNLSSSFTFTIEDDNVLRVEEDGTVLDNETWYAVLNDGGWSGVADFQMDYVVVRGDADNDGYTAADDAADIWAMRDLDPVPDDSRYDIDANGDINALDANDAWGYRGSTAPEKPSGHGCTLP